MDVLCQAKSGMGKTAVFVCATLQQVEPVAGEVAVVVLCHTRELAFQIKNEYARFSKYMPDVRTAVFYGGVNINNDKETLKNKDKCPHIIVATPGRLNALVRDKAINLGTVKNFVLDECDKMLESVGPSFSPSFLVPRVVTTRFGLVLRCWGFPFVAFQVVVLRERRALFQEKPRPPRNVLRFLFEPPTPGPKRARRTHQSQPSILIFFSRPICRHATGRARSLPLHPSHQTGHDVQRHPQQGDPTYLQEVHAERMSQSVDTSSPPPCAEPDNFS